MTSPEPDTFLEDLANLGPNDPLPVLPPEIQIDGIANAWTAELVALHFHAVTSDLPLEAPRVS